MEENILEDRIFSLVNIIMSSGSGVPPQQVAPLEAGANSPQQSAYIRQQNDANTHNNIVQVGKGTRNRRRRQRSYLKGGNSGSGSGSYPVTVSNVSAPYPEAAAGSQTTSSVNTAVTKALVQSTENAKYDHLVGKPASSSGGGRRRRGKSTKKKSTKQGLSFKGALDPKDISWFKRQAMRESKVRSNGIKRTINQSKKFINKNMPKFLKKKRGTLKISWKLS